MNRYKLTVIIRKVNDPDESKCFLFDDLQQAFNMALRYKEKLGENVDVYLNKEDK